jgi:hypothetical protein
MGVISKRGKASELGRTRSSNDPGMTPIECTLRTYLHNSPPRKQITARLHLRKRTLCPNKQGLF